MNPQASFDELIAYSNGALDHVLNDQIISHSLSENQIIQGQQRVLLSSKAASHDIGIDDFLARYKHQQSSIIDFFSCLDEPTVTLKSEQNSKVFRDVEVDFAAVSSEFKTQKSDENKFLSAVVKSQDIVPQESKRHAQAQAAICKRRKKLTSVEREERRRDQNREAQRRYREKHMLKSVLQSRHVLHSYACNGSAVLSQSLPWGYQ